MQGSWFKIIFVVLLVGILMARIQASDYGNIAGLWKVQYGETDEEFLRLGDDSSQNLTIRLIDVVENTLLDYYFVVRVRNLWVAEAYHIISKEDLNPSGVWLGNVTLYGKHLGYTELFVALEAENGGREMSLNELQLIVLREKRMDDKIFTYTAGVLGLLMFVNLGTVLDWKRLQSILFRPMGPFAGFCSRYVIMPALALGLGKWFCPSDLYLQVAVFFTALAPSGGLANICTIFLKGNINLSLATTTINSLMALGMMPFWIYVVGRMVFGDESLVVPFIDLAVSAGALIVAIGFGFLLRLLIPKTTRFVFRFLKPLSIFLSLCLIGVTVGINAFVFQQVTGMIILVAFCLPLGGYLISFLFAKILCRSATDSLTIGIETSVLNMTVPIVLLQFCVEQPRADLITIVPIMCSLVSLLLVLVFYILRRILGFNKTIDEDAFDEKALLLF